MHAHVCLQGHGSTSLSLCVAVCVCLYAHVSFMYVSCAYCRCTCLCVMCQQSPTSETHQSSCGHRRVVFSCQGHCAHLSGSSGAAQGAAQEAEAGCLLLFLHRTTRGTTETLTVPQSLCVVQPRTFLLGFPPVQGPSHPSLPPLLVLLSPSPDILAGTEDVSVVWELIRQVGGVLPSSPRDMGEDGVEVDSDSQVAWTLSTG